MRFHAPDTRLCREDACTPLRDKKYGTQEVTILRNSRAVLMYHDASLAKCSSGRSVLFSFFSAVSAWLDKVKHNLQNMQYQDHMMRYIEAKIAKISRTEVPCELNVHH